MTQSIWNFFWGSGWFVRKSWLCLGNSKTTRTLCQQLTIIYVQDNYKDCRLFIQIQRHSNLCQQLTIKCFHFCIQTLCQQLTIIYVQDNYKDCRLFIQIQRRPIRLYTVARERERERERICKGLWTETQKDNIPWSTLTSNPKPSTSPNAFRWTPTDDFFQIRKFLHI